RRHTRFSRDWSSDVCSSDLNYFLGDKWAPDGVLDKNMYLSLVTIHGTIMVFFVLTGGLSGTFSNLLIPLQIGARDMASGFLNMRSEERRVGKERGCRVVHLE